MDFRLILTTFGMIFLAELGDKTQLATLCFAAESQSRLSVFIGSACALILTSFLGVLCGGVVSKLVPPSYIRLSAGGLFVILSLWMIILPGGK